ncbi:type II secretion system protein [Methylophaga sp. OBS4]|uniref:type II secretion system protein n=1 Tax=Methylophaga sp. OBS4 TaxID=2991935 RepID=UPI00225B84A8|nr:prepilin-type N-terminal cleavage/methylation domain-containing protein [Methylophaga sp. OBS4]MCX4187781.1 prepilin-type N-terminal cleavage/methylation domain-containing protein [Methylophaga sp. OBS4]
MSATLQAATADQIRIPANLSPSRGKGRLFPGSRYHSQAFRSGASPLPWRERVRGNQFATSSRYLGVARHDRSRQIGFTLLEMVLVLFLIGLMASAALMLTENVEDQTKYDETKRRMDIMRKAIVGDPTRTVNGSPEISGFAADMGRLPNCIAELLTAGDASDAAAPITYKSPCDNSEITEWHINGDTKVGSGWRGPYIQVVPERDGDPHFRDGYGNAGTTEAEDNKNSGWFYDVSGATLGLTSSGYDASATSDDVGTDELIVSSDWQLDDITVNFINRNASEALPASDVKLNLRIYPSSLTDYKTGDDGSTDWLTVASGTITANIPESYTFRFDASNAVPIGHHGYVIVCYEVPSGSPEGYVIFDGDCSNDASSATPSSDNIRLFKAAPRQNITIDWIIPQ